MGNRLAHNKYNDNNSTVCPETKSRKYSERDSQNEKYSLQIPKW